ncbi:MAG TPA: hypothetical protein VIX17_17190 [Pyrinomonadaceae bacterium]|jgi:hypothetical protein
MTRKFLAPLIACWLILTTAPVTKTQTTSPAQSARQTDISNWQGLQNLKPGKKIFIEYKSNVGGSLECKFVRVAGSVLTVSDGKSQATIDECDIQRVYRLNGRWSRSTMVKIGAGIGMIVGTFVGAGRGLSLEREPGHIGSEQDEVPAIAGFVIGAAAGASLGALVGGKRKGKLLYDAK